MCVRATLGLPDPSSGILSVFFYVVGVGAMSSSVVRDEYRGGAGEEVAMQLGFGPVRNPTIGAAGGVWNPFFRSFSSPFPRSDEYYW